MSTIHRRTVLAGLGLLGAAPAWAFGVATKVGIAELDLGAGSVLRPSAWSRLLHEVALTTSVEINPNVVSVTPDDDQLFEQPFIVLQLNKGFRVPESEELQRVARYLTYGGFLLIDDATGGADSAVSDGIQTFLRRLFPNRSLSSVPVDHSVNRTFFLLKRAPGRVDRASSMQAITLGTLSPVMVHRNDLGGALLRDASGRYPNPCIPGGESQRREALKVGINLVMYSLTSNYKKDQAHVAQLIKEGRLE